MAEHDPGRKSVGQGNSSKTA